MLYPVFESRPWNEHRQHRSERPVNQPAALLSPDHGIVVYFLFKGAEAFDVTLIETGAYNAMWADVHLGPEQAIDAPMSMLAGS